MWQNKVTGERIPIAMKVIKGNKRNTTFKIHRWSTEQKAMTFEHPNLVKVSFLGTLTLIQNVKVVSRGREK